MANRVIKKLPYWAAGLWETVLWLILQAQAFRFCYWTPAKDSGRQQDVGQK